MDILSTPVLENPEHQTLWYCKFFLGKFHHNFVGQESNEGEKNTYVLSVVEEKSFGKTQCRCIMWTKDGPKRLVIVGSFKNLGDSLEKITMYTVGLNMCVTLKKMPTQAKHIFDIFENF